MDTLKSAMRTLDAYRFGEVENEELQARIRAIYPALREIVNKCEEEGILSEE